MNIDISRHPKDLFADLLMARNPNIGTLTKDDITVRRITAKHVLDYEATYEYVGNRQLTNYESIPGMTISSTDGLNTVYWLVRKWVYFDGSDVEYQFRGDDGIACYIDGVKVGDTPLNTAGESTGTVSLLAGYHEVVLTVSENTGVTYVLCRFSDGTNIYTSGNDWLGYLFPGDKTDFDINDYFSAAYKTSVEVDLLGGVSESYGDFVEFEYHRIPVHSLFTETDTDTSTEAIEITYDINNISMLSGAINNFQDIYDSWYRFSHNASGNYPANESETLEWSYIEEYDCIQSTSNAATFIGFISDDFTDDYIFNTVLTSDQSDDDDISIILGAFKQNDIDEYEHTLALRCHRGGFNYGYITIQENGYQNGRAKRLAILDPSTADSINGGIGWTDVYSHVYAKRTGSLIDIYVIQGDLPVDETKSRDVIIQQLVEDCAILSESDMQSLNYFYYQLNLTTEAPNFDRSVRYGYGQYSQRNSRFWNIRRPNDNPEVTEELKQYFLDGFGWNVGDDGISVVNSGVNKFTVSFDNVVYVGDLTLVPE